MSNADKCCYSYRFNEWLFGSGCFFLVYDHRQPSADAAWSFCQVLSGTCCWHEVPCGPDRAKISNSPNTLPGAWHDGQLMIDYSESWLIFTLLKWKGLRDFICQGLCQKPSEPAPGSVFPRSCLFAVPAALIAVFLVQASQHVGVARAMHIKVYSFANNRPPASPSQAPNGCELEFAQAGVQLLSYCKHAAKWCLEKVFRMI